MFDQVVARLKKCVVTKVVNKIAMHHPVVLAIRVTIHVVQEVKSDVDKAEKVYQKVKTLKSQEESKDSVADLNLVGVDIKNAQALLNLGLFRVVFGDFDVLFDEQGNVFGLKGKFAGNHKAELENYFSELDKQEGRGATCKNNHLLVVTIVQEEDEPNMFKMFTKVLTLSNHSLDKVLNYRTTKYLCDVCSC
jgi:hypothetical protein